MGNPNQGSPPPPGGGGGSDGAGLTAIFNALNTLYNLLVGVFYPGGSVGNTDIITVGTTAVLLYQNNKPVKKAIIQNLSSTDVVTIQAVSGSVGKVAPVTAGKGTLLNPAPGSGQGGGSMPVGNVDLGAFTAITNTNTGQLVSVYYET